MKKIVDAVKQSLQIGPSEIFVYKGELRMPEEVRQIAVFKMAR
jgi:hypothetical protein